MSSPSERALMGTYAFPSSIIMGTGISFILLSTIMVLTPSVNSTVLLASLMVAVFVCSSQNILHPSFSPTKRTGTIVYPSYVMAEASYISSPLTNILESDPTVSFAYTETDIRAAAPTVIKALPKFFIFNVLLTRYVNNIPI